MARAAAAPALSDPDRSRPSSPDTAAASSTPSFLRRRRPRQMRKVKGWVEHGGKHPGRAVKQTNGQNQQAPLLGNTIMAPEMWAGEGYGWWWAAGRRTELAHLLHRVAPSGSAHQAGINQPTNMHAAAPALTPAVPALPPSRPGWTGARRQPRAPLRRSRHLSPACHTPQAERPLSRSASASARSCRRCCCSGWRAGGGVAAEGGAHTARRRHQTAACTAILVQLRVSTACTLQAAVRLQPCLAHLSALAAAWRLASEAQLPSPPQPAMRATNRGMPPASATRSLLDVSRPAAVRAVHNLLVVEWSRGTGCSSS